MTLFPNVQVLDALPSDFGNGEKSLHEDISDILGVTLIVSDSMGTSDSFREYKCTL